VHELSRYEGRDGTRGWPHPPRLRRLDLAGQGGATLIEVLVSAIMVVIVAVGVLAGFDAATRASSEERHRARAHSLGQADLSRMRTMKISDLSNLEETRSVTQDGTEYTIVSRGQFQTDATGTASCEEGTASADYIRISSTVTWPTVGTRPPVVESSIVAPPNGSVSPDTGSLAVEIENAAGVGAPDVPMSLTGPSNHTGVTGANGCAIFGNLPAGNYTLLVTDSTLVDHNGKPPDPEPTSVVAEATATVVLQYDEPGSTPVTFTTNAYGAGVGPARADSIVAFNSGMSLPKAFGTPGSPATEVIASGLFPFTSGYAVYAGTCDGDHPNPLGDPDAPGAAAIASVVVPPGGSAPTTLQIPALNLTVWDGTGPGAQGSPVAGAEVHVADTKCQGDTGGPVTRNFTTNSIGRLDDPGLPWSVYDICAEAGGQHVIEAGVSVPEVDLDGGTNRDFYLGSGAPGDCP
jgi:Tfp pilus assembly protein PilV